MDQPPDMATGSHPTAQIAPVPKGLNWDLWLGPPRTWSTQRIPTFQLARLVGLGHGRPR